jgi:hypothetical protein
MLGKLHTERLVLHGLRVGRNLGFQDVGRGSAINRTSPRAVRPTGEHKLLLSAGE